MDKPKLLLASDRDGTSQAQRLLPALTADYVAIDEHSLKDQLVLAHEFSKELKYFNFDNVAAGDWQCFINPGGLVDQTIWENWLQQIESFIQQPENFNDGRFANLRRPHFVLFLTFLQLLKNTQGQLNELTARHLEFYFRKVLNFTLKPPQSDRVNLLVTPAKQVSKTLLPVGTLLAAGKDSLGKELVYRTDTDLVVNHAQIARLSSIFVDIQNLNITAFGDTLSAKVPGSSDAGRWYTFGQRQVKIPKQEAIPPKMATLGWAISSPLLCLAQGIRTVNLTLLFKPESFNSEKIQPLDDKTNQPFRTEISSAKGWITPKNDSIKTGEFLDTDANIKYNTLAWTLGFDESAPAISALPDMDSSGIKASWPVLRLLWQPRWDGKKYITDYSLFQGLLLEKVLLDVDVKGLAECKLQNDVQTLRSGKPFEPFGSLPTLGSRLYFAHPELALKKLDQLDVFLEWMGLPKEGFKAYYKTYSLALIDNSAFKSKLGLVDQRLEVILNEGAALFNTDETKNSNTLSIPKLTTTKTGGNQGTSNAPTAVQSLPERQLGVSNEEDVTAWSRYWFLELSNSDFQHAVYPSVAAAKAIELASAMVNTKTVTTTAENETSTSTSLSSTINSDTYKVNPPYTPKLKSFSINYKASIDLDAADLQNPDADQLYHLHPFGYAPIQFDNTTNVCRFLPTYDNEGELYIGLDGVAAPQTLSLLLQLAEGTANPDLDSAKVQWSVLNDNAWQQLDQGQMLQDTTNGLLQSGIVKLQLDAVAPSTLLPPDLYWLRVAVESGCDSLCDTIGIDTQAVTATFFDQGNAEDHLNQPLPADTIQNLVSSIPGISSVKQPYTSFASKPKEQASGFNTRISERLRHKQRAVSHWDYERLVLEQFPDIYKAKCIPVGSSENQGDVIVVVIPDVRNRLPFDPFEPKAAANVLADIESYLSAYAPLGANIKVKNAHFQQVRLRFSVQFQPGCDSGFYKQQLNGDVNRFLSPWAYEQGKDIVIGGKIYANAIIDFMERRPYVDYVADFKFFLATLTDHGSTNFERQNRPDFNASDSDKAYFVTAQHPDAVLVAVRNHDIDLVGEVNTGIGYMKIEFDFQVS